MKSNIINNEFSEETKELIRKVELVEEELNKNKKTLDDKDKALSKKDREIQELKNEIALLKGIISTSNRKIFGKSSEQIDTNQLSLFNDAEKYSDLSVEEPQIEEITYKRTKKSNVVGKKDNLANLETIIIEHKLEGDDLKCIECGDELTEIGVKSEKTILKYVPAKLTVEKHIILYDYQSTRVSSCPKKFLGDFAGYLQTDSYVGYNSVSEATRIYCLAHIRRKFYDVISNLDKETLKKSRAIIGFNYCEKIYSLEKALRETYYKEEDYYSVRFKERNEKLLPILNDFIEYIAIEIKNALPKSPLGKALDYAKKQVPSLKNILLDGILEVDNNAAEREIKLFVIGRKNFLFANTSKGVICSATIYSIIETAKANKLVVENYLVYLFENLANIDLACSESLEKLMPWSSTLPATLRIKEKK